MAESRFTLQSLNYDGKGFKKRDGVSHWGWSFAPDGLSLGWSLIGMV